MDKCHNFAANLSAIREVRSLTLSEFSKELHVPKSTLQAILKDGNTSLHTALHIADYLGVSLDTLTERPVPDAYTDMLPAMLKCLSTFVRLPQEKQSEVVYHVHSILEILQA